MILTNQWTEYAHGHARTELRLAKLLLSEKGISSEILSISSNFGDIFSDVENYYKRIPSYLIRGPIYRKSLMSQERNLATSWGKVINGLPEDNHLVITSGYWPQLIQVLRKCTCNRITFRLISPPHAGTIASREQKLVQNFLSSRKLKLGIETLDGLEYLQLNFRIKAEYVPPLTTFATRTVNRSKIGIIWSVTDQVSTSQINRVISLFRNKKLLIKLPLGINQDDLNLDKSRIEIIPNGISDELFENYLGQLQTAYLPHKNYKLRGSGLITSMIGSGIVVIVDEDNSFARDFDFSKLVIVTNDANLQSDLDITLNERNQFLNRDIEAENLRAFIHKQWTDFLVDDRE